MNLKAGVQCGLWFIALSDTVHMNTKLISVLSFSFYCVHLLVSRISFVSPNMTLDKFCLLLPLE